MSVRYSYIALENDHKMVADWFDALGDSKSVGDSPDHLVIYFREMAVEPLPPAEEVNQDKTPLVRIVKPQRRMLTLWTDAEVLFTPTPLKPQYPALQKISKSFAKWLQNFPIVHCPSSRTETGWEYYLEGGIQNFVPVLYALPEAMEALRTGRYFVHHRDNASVLETLARKLRLRGYNI